ncbi:MAG: hypothetical protein A2W31_07290, partial [Planctomycetes bacterium RBG_16_64_10]
MQLAGPRIAAVGRANHTGPVRDLGNVALVPGLVNAHTHLEFSDLPRPLGQPGIPLTDWIRAVLAWRGQQRGDRAAAIARGLRESADQGTTTLGDIVTGDVDPAAWRHTEADVTCFFETMALARGRLDPALAEVRQKLAQRGGTRGRHLGISPHAPYTVHLELLVRLAQLAAAHRLPLAFHLAESPAELRLLRTGDGPLRELLDERAAWDESAIPRGSRPLDYLHRLRPARRVLIIHGNYLDDEELGYLAAQAKRMTLVYCPRTHAFFGHRAYPLAKALRLGVHVAL